MIPSNQQSDKMLVRQSNRGAMHESGGVEGDAAPGGSERGNESMSAAVTLLAEPVLCYHLVHPVWPLT